MKHFGRSDRLVAASVLTSLLSVWLMLVAFDALMAIVAELDEVQEGGYTTAKAALFTLYTLPRRAYQLFPLAALIGCLLGLGSLAGTSELTAMRSFGMSRKRICGSALVSVAVLTALMALVAETVGPAGEQHAQALVLAAKSRDVAVMKWSGLWAREGDTILNARQGRVEGEASRSWVALDGVRLYRFEREGRLSSITQATRAEHRDGRWTLFEVHRSTFVGRGVATTRVAREHWDSKLDPAVLSLTVTRPRYLATRDLAAGLDYQRRNGLDAGLFESAYWSRWFYPVNAIVLCLVVMPFAFGPLRSGGFGLRLFLGITIGLAYYTLQSVAISTAEVYRVDMRLANALPPLLAIVSSWLYFRRRDAWG